MSAKKTTALWLVLLLVLFWGASAAAAPLAGRLILVEGEVAVRPGGAAAWQPARLNQDLFSGDMVRTGANSRAAILCLDESQIKLNDNTVLVLKSVAPSPRLRPGDVTPAAPAPAVSVYQVIQGEIWLRNKKEKFLFELETPTVTATIRGTEFNLRVQPNGTTTVILLEGRLKLTNPHGEVALNPGEEGVTRPGEAPTKRLLVQPADAVQWSLYYPGFFSYRDLPWRVLMEPGGPQPGGPLAAPLSRGEEAYDQGRLTEAEEAAQQILAREPANGRALMLAGWISLQRQRPEEALNFFQRLKPPEVAAVVGAALARYRLGDPLGAYFLVKAARTPTPGQPLLTVMEGFFAMLLGKAEEARQRFTEATAGPLPVAALLGRCYLAQMDIVQNRKAAARTQADQALALNASSPLALLTRALVDIAAFDLPAARQRLGKALKADPRFVDASVYLAKIFLGADDLRQARRTLEQALQQAPRDANVLALAGFVRLALRDYAGARELLEQASRVSPRLGEAHLGLSLYYFRFRELDRGLREMLTATLLDPRISLYQSELGKAYYQTRAFDKALEVWDYAASLDARDPTPHLYKGIALTDLNRPGEAIQAINRSISLNDNLAVFRSRLMLDRDLALRNYNLARAYDQLGLGEWAFSKALTAVKYDPLNSSAHLFLVNSYAASGQLVLAQDAEKLIYRVLAPASQTTFRYLLNNDYTSMFEMPYARATVMGGLGAWEENKTIQEYAVAAYGGKPGLAFYAEGDFLNDRGYRQENGFNQLYVAQGALKWEPTVYGNLTGFFEYFGGNRGDVSNLNDYFHRNNVNLLSTPRFRQGEVSYVHRCTPNWAMLAYFTLQNLQSSEFIKNFGPYFDYLVRGTDIAFYRWSYYNFQTQQQVVLGKHTLIGGFDYFDGHLTQRYHSFYRYWQQGQLVAQFLTKNYFRPPERSYSFYLLDYWRLAPGILVELGLFRDFAQNARYGAAPITTYLWSPRLGLNIQLNPNHTVRLAVLRYLNTHLILQPLLVPTAVAGTTWPVDSDQGSEVREAGAAWEAQWDPKTFSVLRFSALRVASPYYFWGQLNNGLFYPYGAWLNWKRYQGSLVVNRILTNWLGLTLGFTGKRLFFDEAFRPALQDLTEMNGLLGLSFLTPKGWQGGVRTLLVYQHLRDQSDNCFALVNLRFGKELAHKRGLVSFEVQNLFNRHFNYALEPFRDPEFYPARRLIGKLALYF